MFYGTDSRVKAMKIENTCLEIARSVLLTHLIIHCYSKQHLCNTTECSNHFLKYTEIY
jgi:hypothetical protein